MTDPFADVTYPSRMRMSMPRRVVSFLPPARPHSHLVLRQVAGMLFDHLAHALHQARLSDENRYV